MLPMMDECTTDTSKTPTSLTKALKNDIYIRPKNRTTQGPKLGLRTPSGKQTLLVRRMTRTLRNITAS